ncbi:MAG: permease of phosphate ABC transporter [Faecousia sp.]
MKLFEIANQYCKESTWKTLAMLKFCLIAMGIAIGMFIPDGARTVVLVICAVVFVVTYIPLMKKFFDLFRRKD